MNTALAPSTLEYRRNTRRKRDFCFATITLLLLMCASIASASDTPQPKHPPQAHPHRQQKALSHTPSATVKPLAHAAPRAYTATQNTPHVPTGPGPRHGNAHATSGLSAGTRQSLNPQPIPPGRSRHSLPPQSAPHQNDVH